MTELKTRRMMRGIRPLLVQEQTEQNRKKDENNSVTTQTRASKS